MAQDLQPFDVTFSCPGLHEVERVFAVDAAEAMEIARERSRQPRQGWPHLFIRQHGCSIGVVPALMPIARQEAAE